MEAETWKVYLTNNIVSFEVHPDELLLDLVYVPGYKATQDTWYGYKTIWVDGCWTQAENVTPDGKLKNLNWSMIIEENFVFDPLSREGLMRDHDIKDNEVCIEESKFSRWYTEFNDDGNLYYQVDSDENGICRRIKVYAMGCVETLTLLERRYTRLYIREDRVAKLTREIAENIKEYPFFYYSKTGELIFSDMIEGGKMKYVL